MTIQEQITQYFDHLSDIAYIDSVLKSAELEAIYQTITELLRSGQVDQINVTLIFLRDVMLMTPPEIKPPFDERFYTSSIIDALHDLLFVDQHFIRNNAIYTIGKLCIRSSVGVLIKAFEHYLEADPLLLPGLLFELGWLGHTHEWDRLELMVQSTSYLTRWAGLSTLDGFYNPNKDEEAVRRSDLQKHYLELLNQDSHPLIRAEADYKLRKYHFDQTLYPNKAEQKQARKEFEKYAPQIPFDMIGTRFFQYHVPRTQRFDYSLSELDAFVVSIAEGK